MEQVTTKKCTLCGKEYPATAEYFYRNKARIDGLRCDCKICMNARNKKYWEKHAGKRYQIHKAYVESHRDRLTELAKVYRKNHSDEIRARKKAYSREHKDELAQKTKDWIKKNPDKYRAFPSKQKDYNNVKVQRCIARKSGRISTLSVSEWKRIKSEFANSCAYCGVQTDDLQQDHFVPKSLGGNHEVGNIIPACKSCNSSKNNKEFSIWYRSSNVYNLAREQKIIQFIRNEQEQKNNNG